MIPLWLFLIFGIPGALFYLMLILVIVAQVWGGFLMRAERKRSLHYRVIALSCGQPMEAHHYGKTKRKILKQYEREQIKVLSIDEIKPEERHF